MSDPGIRPVSECQSQVPALLVSVRTQIPAMSGPGPHHGSECQTQVPTLLVSDIPRSFLTNEILFLTNEILFRTNEIISFCTNEILFRTNAILFRTNKIIFRTNEILFRTNEIKKITTLNVPLWAPYMWCNRKHEKTCKWTCRSACA